MSPNGARNGLALAAWGILSLPSVSAAQAAPDARPIDAGSATASAPREPPAALEVSATVGPTIVFGSAANPEYERSLSRVGVLATASFGYRSSYFLDPSLEVGYASLASGHAELPDGIWGQGGALHQHLGEWIISPSVSADIWRFRPRLGLGLAVVSASNEYHAEQHGSSQVSLLSQLELGFELFRSQVVRLDAAARAVLVPGADVTFVSAGVSARFDIVTFGQR